MNPAPSGALKLNDMKTKTKLTLKQSSHEIVALYDENGVFVGRTLGSTDKSNRYYITPEQALHAIISARDSDRYEH